MEASVTLDTPSQKTLPQMGVERDEGGGRGLTLF